jgi:putative ABC transport system substrate-binding protein
MRESEAGAIALGIEVVPVEIRLLEDFSLAFQVMKPKADALYVAIDQLMVANLMRILTLAASARDCQRSSALALCSRRWLPVNGPSYTERFQRAADYMDKILRGAKPGDIPASSAACGYGSAGSAMNQRRFIASTSLGEHGEKADRCLYQGKRL